MGLCNSDWPGIGTTIANRVPMGLILVSSVYTVGWIIGDAGLINLVGGHGLVDWSQISERLVDCQALVWSSDRHRIAMICVNACQCAANW